MRMHLETLLNKFLKEGKLSKQSSDVAFLNNLLDGAKRNFDAASLIRGKVDEAAFKLAYDGLLQIGRIILLINGYRPADGEQHKTTFTVAGALLGEDFDRLIKKIQKFRIKRNISLYEPKLLINKNETEAIFKTAREFWDRVKIYLRDKNTQLKLFEDI